jgi:hypothetical protein
LIFSGAPGPDDCLEQMQAFADAGCRHFVLSPLMDAKEFVAKAGSEILPRLRTLRPAPASSSR